MEAQFRSSRKRTFWSLIAVAGALTAAMVLTAPAARAGGIPTPWELHKKIHERAEEHVRDLIDLPRRIHDQHKRLFRNFFSGRVYYRPHQHYHTIYRLPVYTRSSVVYRPYSYCNDALFMDAAVRLPQIAIHVGTSAPMPAYQPASFYYVPAPVYAGPSCPNHPHGHHGHDYEDDHGGDDHE